MAPSNSSQPEAVVQFFDSAAAYVKDGSRADAAKALTDGSVSVPKLVNDLIAKYPEKAHHALIGAVLDGVATYRVNHNREPSAGFIENAIQSAVNGTMSLQDIAGNAKGVRLDAATSAHHDQLSLSPARPILSILQSFESGVPFAQYLPTDVRSNEAKLAIITHTANSDFGGYLNGAMLNGVAGGAPYMNSERVFSLATNGGAGPFAYQVTQKSDVAVGAGNVALPLLRGRSEIMVNGYVVAEESRVSSGSGNNSISGTVVLGGTSHAITGTVNTDTGLFSVSAAPALPANTVVEGIAFIDYERAPQMAPKIGARADVYSMYAHPSRGLVSNTIDTVGQVQLELGADMRSQSLMATRSQYELERHYLALRKGYSIGKNLSAAWVYDWVAQYQQKTRSTIWQDFASIIAGLSQQMVNANNSYGIKGMYVTGELAAQIRGLPNDIFQSSGIVDRPGVYRLGRLFGLYEVYYTPNTLVETGGGIDSQILCYGYPDADVARSPFVMGDAVSPLLLPIAMGQDMVYQDGFYARGFARVNPHQMSAQGFAIINVTAIK
jgi:hypothetical protein